MLTSVTVFLVHKLGFILRKCQNNIKYVHLQPAAEEQTTVPSCYCSIINK